MGPVCPSHRSFTMSTAMWMNERITTENRKFPPEKQELPAGSPPRKTQRDAHTFPCHGAKAEEEWLANRRRELWNNKSFERTVASNRLSNVKSSIVKQTPHLRDPRRDQEEVDACIAKFRSEKERRENDEFKVYGRPKSEEVAFMERMQGFSELTRA